MRRHRVGRMAAWFVVVIGVAAAAAGTIRVPEDQPTIADAIAVAVAGDLILVQEYVFGEEPSIDWLDKAVRVESTDGVTQPGGGVYRLAPGATIASGLYQELELWGELRSPASGAADAHAGTLQQHSGGRIIILPNARLNISLDSQADLYGNVTVEDNGVLSISLPENEFVSLGYEGCMTLMDGARFHSTAGFHTNGSIAAFDAQFSVAQQLTNAGSWNMNGGRISATGRLDNEYDGWLVLYGSELTVGMDLDNHGTLRMFDGLLLAGQIWNDTDLDLLSTTVSAQTLINDNYADLTGSGFWVVDLENRGDFDCIDDTTVVGDVLNDGTIRILMGTLTILGSLTNNGTIVGDYRGLRGDAYGLQVGDDLTAGLDAGLFMSNPALRVRVDGHFSVATIDNQRYDMVQAALLLGSLAGSFVDLEVMSLNIGPDPAGLDRTQPGHFPIGTVHLAGSTVTLVDHHDNDLRGFEQREALYVDTLQIDAGATLNTAGFRVYYNTLINNGTVDDPENLVQYGSGIPGDLDGDGCVDQADLGILLAAFGIDAGGDLDGDQDTDQADLGILLAHWGEGCP